MASNASAQRDNARPTFTIEAIQNAAKSLEAGRPIFDEKEMVRVRIPGDKQMTWDGFADDPVFINPTTREKISAAQRWPDHYAAFKKGEARAASGTPLDQWPNPTLTKGRVAELKAMDILSVEELAGVSDSILPKMGMGARELRDQARSYIDKATAGAGDAKLAAEVARLKEMVDRLTGNVATPSEPKTKTLEDCTDAELKDYLKRETGESVRGNPSRETLMARARSIAEQQAA